AADGSAAARAGDCRADRRTRVLPASNAALGAGGHARRCPRDQGAVLGPHRRRRDVAHRDLPGGACPADDAPRRRRLRVLRVAHQVRTHRLQGLDLQGRDPSDARGGAYSQGGAGACPPPHRSPSRAGRGRRRRTRRGCARRRAAGVPGNGELAVLMPKRTKHRKQHRARIRSHPKGGTVVNFGEWGLQSTSHGYLTNRQIEAARVAMTRYIKRGGKVWVTIFPDRPVTKKAAETRMGSGKGNPEEWVAAVRPGRVLFEL